MILKKYLSPCAIGIVAVLFICSCKDEEVEPDSSEPTESLDDFIFGLGDPIQPNIGGNEQIGDVLTEIDENTKTYCECTKYKASESFSEVLLMDPTSDVIYPGSILEGNSVAEGSYRQIVLERGPLTVSTDFPNIVGEVVRTVEKPSLSSLTQTMKEMMYDSGVDGATPAACSFEIKEIVSEEQLSMAVGASVEYNKLKLRDNFDFSKTSTTSKYLVKFQQVYYTVNVDAPSSPSKFFDSSVSASDLKQAIGGGSTVPVYVSSIKYGRAAYFCVESNEKSDSVANVLESSFKLGKSSIVLNDSMTAYKKMKDYSVSGTIIGGSSEDAVGAVKGYEKMIEFITNGGNFSKESPAKPVAFTLRRLSNNEVFGVVNSTEYVARNCKSTNASITAENFYGLKGENDVCGTIKVCIKYPDGEQTPWFYVFNQPISKSGSISVPIGKTEPAPMADHNIPFTIDYSKFEGAKLIVSADLHEWDDPCKCGNDHREFDDYDSYYNEFLLSDVEKDEKVVLEFSLTKEYTEDHHYTGLFNSTVAHSPKNIATDCKVQFTFNVKIQ